MSHDQTWKIESKSKNLTWPPSPSSFLPSPHCSLRSLVATAKALWYQPHPTSKHQVLAESSIKHDETWWSMIKHLAVLVLVQSWQDPGAFRGCTTHTLWGGSNSVITPGPRRATCGQPESVSSRNDNLYLYHFCHPVHLLIVNLKNGPTILKQQQASRLSAISADLYLKWLWHVVTKKQSNSCHASESNHSVGHTIQVRISASVKMR